MLNVNDLGFEIKGKTVRESRPDGVNKGRGRTHPVAGQGGVLFGMVGMALMI